MLLDSEQVEGVDKTIAIEMKSNSQGKFVKITEVCVCVCVFVYNW